MKFPIVVVVGVLKKEVKMQNEIIKVLVASVYLQSVYISLEIQDIVAAVIICFDLIHLFIFLRSTLFFCILQPLNERPHLF